MAANKKTEDGFPYDALKALRRAARKALVRKKKMAGKKNPTMSRDPFRPFDVGA